MEKLKKTCTIVRTAFTRNIGILSTELMGEALQVQEMQARLAMVRDNASELKTLN